MDDTDLTPFLNDLVVQSGILHKAVVKNVGAPMNMPLGIRTPLDKSSPEIYYSLKMVLVVRLTLAFLDERFPNLAKEKGHEYRGQIAARLAFETYRMLTDGLSIDVMRAITGEPDPMAQGTKQ